MPFWEARLVVRWCGQSHTPESTTLTRVESVMFSSGLVVVVVVVSTLRFHQLIHLINSHNPTWDYWGPGLRSCAELFVPIICACLPAAKVFAGRILKSLPCKWPWQGSSNTSDNSGTSKQAVMRPSPVLTIVSTNQISLRTSITVSSPQDRQEEKGEHFFLGCPHWEHDSGSGSASCSGRTRTGITAGSLPASPWLSERSEPS